MVCCDPSERRFQTTREPFDPVALVVKFGVEVGGSLAIGLWRDDVDCVLFPDHLSDPAGVTGFVRQPKLTGLQAVQALLARRRIIGLTGRRFKPDRQAVLLCKVLVCKVPVCKVPVCKSVDFRAQAAPGTT